MLHWFQETSIKCYEDSEWTDHFPHSSILMMILYTFGVPLAIGGLLTFGHLKKIMHSTQFEFTQAFGTLYKKYKPSYVAWEIVVMARKLLLQVASWFLTNNASLQACCALLVLVMALVLQVSFLRTY